MAATPKAQATDILEAVQRQRAAKPELARQKRQRVGHKADGGIHAVKRAQTPSRVQEGGDVHEIEWPTVKRHVRASALPAIVPPPGYQLKYVRRDNRSRGDNANLLRHLHEGWVVARASMFKLQHLPTTRIAGHGEVIGNDDSILMICTIEKAAERIRGIREKTANATRGVHEDNNLRNVVTPQMPLVREVMNSSAQFHRMRKKQAVPADDEGADE